MKNFSRWIFFFWKTLQIYNFLWKMWKNASLYLSSTYGWKKKGSRALVIEPKGPWVGRIMSWPNRNGKALFDLKKMVTHHSLLSFPHPSLIIHHLKYPNFLPHLFDTFSISHHSIFSTFGRTHAWALCHKFC